MIKRKVIIMAHNRDYRPEDIACPNQIITESELVGDLGINSLELADLVMLCEDKFDVEIDEEELRKFITVGDVADYFSTLK